MSLNQLVEVSKWREFGPEDLPQEFMALVREISYLSNQKIYPQKVMCRRRSLYFLVIRLRGFPNYVFRVFRFFI